MFIPSCTQSISNELPSVTEPDKTGFSGTGFVISGNDSPTVPPVKSKLISTTWNDAPIPSEDAPAPELYNVLKSVGVSVYPCQIVTSSKLNPFSVTPEPNAEPPQQVV